MLKTIPNGAPTIAVVLLASVMFAHLRGCIPAEQPPPPPVVGPVQPPPPPPLTPVGPVQPTPAPAPQPQPPGNRPALVLTAIEYRDNFGRNFVNVGDRIASGELATRDAILEALKANAQPFNESLGAAIQGACSANGAVSDKDGLAKVFRAVGEATGGK